MMSQNFGYNTGMGSSALDKLEYTGGRKEMVRISI